jgi:hypothetical protein
MGTDVLVLVTLRQNQQQPFAHLNGSTALRAGEQCCFQTFKSGSSLLRHVRYQAPGFIASSKFAVAQDMTSHQQ